MMSFAIRLVLWVIITLQGPLLWWLGGGNERDIALAGMTFTAGMIGAMIVLTCERFPWEKY